MDDLRDVLVRVERVDVADLHLHRVAQELVREGADGARPRRRVEERLPLLRDAAADDLADLRLEAHVEHAVGLVHHDVVDLVHPHLPRLEEVVEAPRRHDDDVHAAPHLAELRPLGRAAVQADRVHARALAELPGLVLYLRRQLARRRHHQRRRPRTRVGPVLHDPDERGHHEGERLARAGLGDADDVLPAHRQAPRGRLDGRWRREACAIDVGHDRLWEVGRLKGHEGVGRAPRQVHLVLGAPRLHVGRHMREVAGAEDVTRAIRLLRSARWRGRRARRAGGDRPLPARLVGLGVPVVGVPRIRVLRFAPAGGQVSHRLRCEAAAGDRDGRDSVARGEEVKQRTRRVSVLRVRLSR